MKVKTGQTVKVISGKDKGKTGQVIQVFPKLNKVVVDGVNTAYKHLKRQALSGSESGQRVEFFAPIHVSNVKVVEEQAKEEKSEKKGKAKEEKTEKQSDAESNAQES